MQTGAAPDENHASWHWNILEKKKKAPADALMPA